MTLPKKAPGQVWGYREKASDPDRPVHGLDRWVPRGRLLMPWEEVEAWLDDGRRTLTCADQPVQPASRLEFEAVEEVFMSLPGELDAGLGYPGWTRELLEAPDPGALAAHLDVPAGVLWMDATAFADRHGRFFAPWPTALWAARRLTEVHGAAVLRDLGRRGGTLIHEAQYGYTTDLVKDWRGEPVYVEPKHCKERLEKERPLFDLIRSWCRVDPVAWDRARLLERDNARLRALVEELIHDLGLGGDHRRAKWAKWVERKIRGLSDEEAAPNKGRSRKQEGEA